MSIKLRPLTLDDSEKFFYAAWDENVFKFIRGFYCDSLNTAKETIKNLLSNPAVTAYVIASQEIPFIGVLILSKNGIKAGKKAFEISYFIDEKFRKKGFATEAVRKILQENKNCRIYLDILKWNKPSLAIAKKFNAFKEPGIDDLYFIDT